MYFLTESNSQRPQLHASFSPSIDNILQFRKLRLRHFELNKNWIPNVITTFVLFIFVHLVNFTVFHEGTTFSDQPATRQTRKTFLLCATTALNLIASIERKKCAHTKKTFFISFRFVGLKFMQKRIIS